MADDTPTDAILAGALFVGGGLAGYFGSRWLRPKEASAATAPTTGGAAPVAAPPDALVISTSASSTRVRPRPEPAPTATPLSPLPNPYEDAPVSSYDPLDAAPVSSPAQVDAPTQPPPGALPRTFDPLFERFRGGIPIELLRALAMRESGMKPTIKGRAAWGLLQITEVVRVDFNDAHGTKHARERLLEPAINIEIGCWLLRLIADRYERRHGDLRNMRADWSNPRFAELAVLGWNAGWSSGSGVMRVVARLKELGARDVDIDLVHQNAGQLGGGPHLRDPKRIAWCKGVVALYLRERGASAPNRTNDPRA